MKDYGSTMLHCKINLIPSFPWIAPHALHPGAIQGKEGIKFCHLATLISGSPVSGGPNDDHGGPAGLVSTPYSIAANLEDLLAEKVDRSKERDDENKLSPKVSVMKPILRFLQLLCENHNRSLQNLLRDQMNKTKYNLVCETLVLLDVICGSTTGGLGLLGLYINENNVLLINQGRNSIERF